MTSHSLARSLALSLTRLTHTPTAATATAAAKKKQQQLLFFSDALRRLILLLHHPSPTYACHYDNEDDEGRI